MREILFRGKASNPVIKNKWVYGSYFEKIGYGTGTALLKKPTLIVSEPEKSSGIAIVDIYKSTVGEYTGLTDKNGKKIFEGDCFKTYCTGLPVYKHIVGYYPEHFAFMARCIETNTVHYLSDYRPSAIEVIGNIHDNPELLEVEK